MRKFTKGLLLTFVATAMSVGVNGQDFDGYYRAINVGYLNARGTGVMNVTSPTTAQPQAKEVDAVTMPGTVLYVNAVKANVEDPDRPYVDVNPEDLEVLNLRSQAVDASKAVYGPIVALMKEGFSRGLSYANSHNNWGLSKEEREEALEAMFDLMKMYMEPTTDSQGNDAFYLKSTTPDPRPLADMLIEKGVVEDSEDLTQDLWNMMYDSVRDYCDEAGDEQFWTEWEYFFEYELSGYTNRIHMGHTYYLIGGHVKTNFNTHTQKFDMGPVAGEFVSFANKNTVDYPTTGYTPEIEIAGDFAKWYIKEIVPGTETDDYNYFALDAFVQGLDGKYYQTIYTDFPMEIVNNGDNTVRVWGIPEGPKLGTFESVQPNPGDIVGYVTTKEYKGVVPARTPVVVECNSTAHVNNLLNPAGNPVEDDVNKAIQDETDRSFLRGIFFAEDFDGGSTADDADEFIYKIRPIDANGYPEVGTPVGRKYLRVFNRGKNTLNPLGFFKYNGGTVLANRAFMILDDETARANIYIVGENFGDDLDGINEVNAAEVENTQIYDIQGRIVNNPTKGLYIVNGKKMVIK
ncbi:MAG: hypothetical protein IKR05_15590 [Prevotella sp.]|nr:hypothetical protein [Prevotella sp.]